MTFADAVRSVLTQYATFPGRARRSEYWWFYLFSILVSIATGIIDEVVGVEVVSTVASLALLVPTLAVTVRRLHDSGRSAWWLLAMFLPMLVGAAVAFAGVLAALDDGEPSFVAIGLGSLLVLAGVVLSIVLMCLPGTVGPNRYGPSPLGPPPGSHPEWTPGSAYLQQPYGGPAAPYGQPPYGQPGSSQPFPQHPTASPPTSPEVPEQPGRRE